MIKKIIHIFLFLLIASICLSPRFPLGSLFVGRDIDVRAEDFVLLFGLLLGIFYFLLAGKVKIKKPPLFWPIVAWSIFGLFSILINLMTNGLDVALAFFYFTKEIEFFLLYLFVFYCLVYSDVSKKLIKYWFFAALINLAWLFYVYAFKVEWSSSYGPNTFIEPKGPFPSGGFFLMLFIFFLNLFVFYYANKKISISQKIMLFILSVAPAIGVISSGSRTSVAGLFFATIITGLLYASKKVDFSRFLKSAGLMIIIIFLFFQIMNVISVVEDITYGDPTNIVKRISFGMSAKAFPDSRFEAAKERLHRISQFPPLNFLVGLGIDGEAHSQYLRVLTERGVLGLIIFGWLVFSVIKISYVNAKEKNDDFKKGLSAGLLVATLSMLVMGIPNDTFMVVKPDEVYWFFAAMAMAAIAKQSNQKETKIIHEASS